MISVILPVYNEEAILETNVKKLRKVLSKDLPDHEIIICEDGSSDGTLRIAKSLEGGNIRVIHTGKRIGKGASIRHAADQANGGIIVFVDADLASSPGDIRKLVDLIERGADIVIGSRYLSESDARRDMVRYFASRSFNFLVRLLFGSRISDHQCGFKAFRKSALKIINRVESRRWFWDTEFLVRAQREGLKIVEIPIEWKEMDGSKFNLFKDTYHMGVSMIRFKMKNW